MIAADTDRLARTPRPPRSALAARAHALSRVGVGDHAAADPGGHRHRLLPALHAALSRYCSRWPAAPLDEVLHLWSGLGYYSRARNLQRARSVIVSEHGGELPAEARAAGALPGIGRSTAAAIVALAIGRRARPSWMATSSVCWRATSPSRARPATASDARQLWGRAEQCTPQSRCRGLYPGDHGFRCDAVHAPRSAVHAMPAARGLRRRTRPGRVRAVAGAARARERADASRVIHAAGGARDGEVLLQRRPAAGHLGRTVDAAGVRTVWRRRRNSAAPRWERRELELQPLPLAAARVHALRSGDHAAAGPLPAGCRR